MYLHLFLSHFVVFVIKPVLLLLYYHSTVIILAHNQSEKNKSFKREAEVHSFILYYRNVGKCLPKHNTGRSAAALRRLNPNLPL